MTFRGRPARSAAPEPEVAADAGSGRKRPITLTVSPELLARIDALARRKGISRTALMILATSEMLEGAGA